MEKINPDAVAATLDRRVSKSNKTRTRLRSKEARYTLVLHAARRQLGLNIDQYVLADSIHKLSGMHSPVPGWCIASKGSLATTLDIPERTLYRLLKSLRAKNLIEIHPETRHLRTTKKWYQTVEVTKSRVFGST